MDSNRWLINRDAVDVAPGKLSIESESGYFIAQVDEGAHQEKHARLIAAAPEMLEALREAIQISDENVATLGRTADCQRVYDLCAAAIAKATGQ